MARYIEGIAKAYANRGEDTQFEVHQFPDISDEEFIRLLNEYGMKKTGSIMAGIPQVHFVIWNYESEYYDKNLKILVDSARQRKSEELRRYIQEEKQKRQNKKRA